MLLPQMYKILKEKKNILTQLKKRNDSEFLNEIFGNIEEDKGLIEFRDIDAEYETHSFLLISFQ